MIIKTPLILSPLLLFFSSTYSQNDIIYKQPIKENIGSKVEFFIDDENSLTLNEIKSSRYRHLFRKSLKAMPNFLLPNSTLWGKFTLVNESKESCYLFIEHPRIHHLEFFYPRGDGNYISKTVGYFQPLTKREFMKNSYIFELGQDNKPITYYFRIRSEEQIILPLSITTIQGLVQKWQAKNLFLGIYLGIIFISLFANLQFYISTREKFYLFHLLRILALVIVIDIGTNGLLFRFVFPENPSINKNLGIFFGLAIIAEAVFCKSFLKTKYLFPKLDKLMYLIIGLGLISIVLTLTTSYYITNLFVNIAGLITTASLIVSGILAYSKYKPALYFVLGTGCYSTSAFIYVLMLNDLFPKGDTFHMILSWGLALETTVTTIGLAYLVKLLRVEKEKAQQAIIHVMNKYNDELEKEIQERTKEIEAQNEEILSQNEEIITQNEELSVTQNLIRNQNAELEKKNSKLEEAKRTIEEQNVLLRKYTQDLEVEIAHRTGELQRINTELIQQNHQLEQFSYITAHNLRSPVARLLGLTSLLNLQESNQISLDDVEIRKKISQTSKDLDEVIHDITAMLEIKKGSHQNYEIVEFDQKIAHIQLLLKDEIHETRTTFRCNFSEISSIFSLPAYIESIFYNLINNSIKYKHYGRDPIISIQSFKEDNTVRIQYRDNGIGLDVAQFKEKIFGLYQRFNLHVEGKGLGLHLVKTQIESLGGSITVKSKPGDGIEFTIVLPINTTEHIHAPA